MLIELLSQSNYQSYNVNLAHKLGLNNSIYLGLLIELNEKAIRKEKLNDSKYFIVDRNYVQSRTTLSQDEQLNIEDTLVSMGLLDRNQNGLKVNINVITELLITGDESINADLDKIRRMAGKSSKNDLILKNVKRNIKENYPSELRAAYCEWLDVVNSKFHFVSNQMLLMAENCIDDYAKNNLDVALDVLRIAQANGWKDVKYAIKKHQESIQNIVAQKNDNIEVMSGVEF